MVFMWSEEKSYDEKERERYHRRLKCMEKYVHDEKSEKHPS
jgi:hypothetical protein